MRPLRKAFSLIYSKHSELAHRILCAIWVQNTNTTSTPSRKQTAKHSKKKTIQHAAGGIFFCQNISSTYRSLLPSNGFSIRILQEQLF